MVLCDFVNLPSEVWLHVFENFTSDRNALEAVTLTCPTFRWLAQPHLFTTFGLSFFSSADISCSLSVWSTDDSFRLFCDRLAFYRSPRIAPSVKTLSLSRRICPTPRNGIIDVQRPLSIFCMYSVCFYNVTEFCCSAPITIHQLSPLTDLPCLAGIDISTGLLHDPRDDISHVRFRLRTLNMTCTSYPANSRLIQDYTNGLWEIFLCRETLEDIRVNVDNVASSSLLNHLSSSLPFYGVRKLCLPLMAPLSPTYASALERCPNVEDFGFFVTSELLASFWTGIDILPQHNLPSHILPCLNSVAVPRQYAPNLLRGRRISRVSIIDRLPEKIDDLVMEIYRLCPRLTHLTLERSEETSSLPFLLSIFPTLQYCEINPSQLDRRKVGPSFTVSSIQFS